MPLPSGFWFLMRKALSFEFLFCISDTLMIFLSRFQKYKCGLSGGVFLWVFNCCIGLIGFCLFTNLKLPVIVSSNIFSALQLFFPFYETVVKSMLIFFFVLPGS